MIVVVRYCTAANVAILFFVNNVFRAKKWFAAAILPFLSLKKRVLSTIWLHSIPFGQPRPAFEWIFGLYLHAHFLQSDVCATLSREYKSL